LVSEKYFSEVNFTFKKSFSRSHFWISKNIF